MGNKETDTNAESILIAASNLSLLFQSFLESWSPIFSP